MKLKTFLTLNSFYSFNLNSFNLFCFVQSFSLLNKQEWWFSFYSFSLLSFSILRKLHHVTWFCHLQLIQTFSKCFEIKQHFKKDWKSFDYAHCVQVTKMTYSWDWIKTMLMYKNLYIFIWFKEIISCIKSKFCLKWVKSACLNFVWMKIVSCNYFIKR